MRRKKGRGFKNPAAWALATSQDVGLATAIHGIAQSTTERRTGCRERRCMERACVLILAESERRDLTSFPDGVLRKRGMAYNSRMLIWLLSLLEIIALAADPLALTGESKVGGGF